MGSRICNFSCMVVLGFVIGSTAHAQQYYNDEPNLFVKPAYKSGFNSDDDKRNELENHISSSTRYHDVQKGSEYVTTMRPQGEEETELAKESEEKISTVTHQLPLQGQQMLQNSEAIRDMLDTGLDGVLTLFKITAHQTEPAEAAGAQGAEVISALLQNNMYQSQNLLHLQYISDPNMYRTSMQMYSACMSERTATYTQSNEGSWIKALAECMGDGVVTGSAAVKGPEQFDTTEDTAYQPEYHPAMKALNKTDEELKLTDLLFNELEEKQGSNPTALADGLDVGELRTSWIELFGDKILRYDVPDTSSGFFPIRQGTSLRILPNKAGTPTTISGMVRERADERFNSLREILHFYCTVGGSGMTSINPFGSAPTKIHADEDEYWTNNGASLLDQEKEALSLPGQPIRVVTLQGLYDNFKQRFGDSQGQVDCNPLDPGSPIEDLNQFNGLGNAVYLEFFAHLRAIARKIAQAQLLIAGIYAQDFVNERASGFGLDPDIRQMALQMISESYNGHGFNGADLQVQLVETIEGLNELIGEIFLQRAKTSGKSSVVSTTSKGRTASDQ